MFWQLLYLFDVSRISNRCTVRSSKILYVGRYIYAFRGMVLYHIVIFYSKSACTVSLLFKLIICQSAYRYTSLPVWLSISAEKVSRFFCCLIACTHNNLNWSPSYFLLGWSRNNERKVLNRLVSFIIFLLGNHTYWFQFYTLILQITF